MIWTPIPNVNSRGFVPPKGDQSLNGTCEEVEGVTQLFDSKRGRRRKKMVGIHISLLANRCCPHRLCTTDNMNSLRVLDSQKKDKPNSSRNSRMNYKVFQEKCIIFVV